MSVFGTQKGMKEMRRMRGMRRTRRRGDAEK
jgi:hypothetical protein